jgi:hypothetical protein
MTDTNSDKHAPLTPEQIEASKKRLLNEGFTAGSKAVRVHDQLLNAIVAHEVNTNRAVESMEALKSECERLTISLEAAKLHAIGQDCGRLCDANPDLKYREQWKDSEVHVERLIQMALAEKQPVAESEGV